MRRPPSTRRLQRGAAAVMVLAVIVLVGGLAAYASSLVAGASDGRARELARQRASAAAQAGLDWGRFRVRTGAAALCTPVQTMAALPGTLAPYTVTVRCTARGPFTEGAAVLRVYELAASACNAPAAGACPAAAPVADAVQVTARVLVER